jgi:hypothetical protein
MNTQITGMFGIAFLMKMINHNHNLLISLITAYGREDKFGP